MTNLLHIYGQHVHHDDVAIVGSKEVLIKLREAINRVLESGEPSAVEGMVNDGEGFYVFITLTEDDDINLAVPYFEDYAREQRKDAKWPHDVIGEEKYKELTDG